MELEQFINSCIYDYPTLYRCDTHKESRLCVLEHIFLHYGTGLEWHPKGFLAYTRYNRITGIQGYDNKLSIKELPKNFYEMNLWYVDIAKKDLPALKEALGSNFHYTRPPLRGEVEVVFEADEELANKLTNQFEFVDDQTLHIRKMRESVTKMTGKVLSSARQAISGYHSESPKVPHDMIHTPYPMCGYSPIVEMINKKTNSCHIDNFELTTIQPDWIKGAIEVSEESLKFYKDSELLKHCYYHPDKALFEFKRIYDKDPAKFVKDREAEGMTMDIKIEDWCEICWQKYLKEQIGYFTKFLEMYKGK